VIRAVIVAAGTVGWMKCVCSNVDMVIREYHSLFGVIFLGTLSGCGGGLLEVLEQKVFNRAPIGPLLGLKLSFIMATVYYSQHKESMFHLQIISHEDTKILLGVLLFAWAFVAEISGPIDPLSYVESFLRHNLLNKHEEKVPKKEN